MYGFRLWIELSESAEESDLGHLEEKCTELQNFIDIKLQMIRQPQRCVFHVNYSKLLQCSGGANHLGSNHDALLEILRHIVDKLPGSRGIVYWFDDEDTTFNCYRVLVIAGGKFREERDPFLPFENSVG